MPENAPRVLATYLDDGWEPDEAVRILSMQAPPGRHVGATAICLRVPGGEESRAEVLRTTAQVPGGELPTEAEYLWVLSSGPSPTLAFLLALYREFQKPSSDAWRVR